MNPAIQTVILPKELECGTTTPPRARGAVDEETTVSLTAGEDGIGLEAVEAALATTDSTFAERGWEAGIGATETTALGLGCPTAKASGFGAAAGAVCALGSTEGTGAGEGIGTVSKPRFSDAAGLASVPLTLGAIAESSALTVKDSDSAGAIFSTSAFLPDRISGAAITG